MNVDALAARACAEVQRDRHLGSAAVDLLYAIFGEEVRRFPVLRPPGGWTEPTLHDEVHSFFVKKVEKLTADLTAVGITGPITGKLVRRYVRNWLVSRARKTPMGRIRRKLEEDVLPVHRGFVRVAEGAPGAGRWHLQGQPSYPYGGETRPLVLAAYGVDNVKPVRWSGPRRPPMASDADLRRIVVAVLEAAAGSLEVGQLTHVLAQRFPAAAEPEDCLLDESFSTVRTREGNLESELAIPQAVRDALDQLSPSQQLILPLLEDNDIDAVKAALGCGRSQAYDAVKRLRELLDRVLPEDETRAAVLAQVVAECAR